MRHARAGGNGGETFPAFPAHAQTAILRIWWEAHVYTTSNKLPWHQRHALLTRVVSMTSYITSKQEFTESASTQDPTHLSERFAGSAYFHSSRRKLSKTEIVPIISGRH